MKAIVFDMDGVLFDTQILYMKCWMAVAQEMHLPDMDKIFPQCIGLNANDSESIVRKAYGEDFDYRDFRQRTNAWFHRYIDENGLPLKPGVYQILDWLRETGCPVGLASSTKGSSVRRYLEQKDMSGYFSAVVTGDMVEHSKPRPDIYLLACGELGVEPENTYAVEDSPNGIRAARAAGMHPIMVPDMIMPDEEMRGLSHVILGSLTEVLEYLRQKEEWR